MWDKIKIPLMVIGLGIILVIVLSVRSCINENRISRTSELEGRVHALEEAAEKEQEEHQEAIQQMQKEIDARAKEVREKSREIAALREEINSIEPAPIVDEPEPGQDWQEIAKQNAQAAREWRGKYFDAEKIIKHLGEPIPDGVDPQTGEKLFRYPYGSVTYNLNQKYLLAADQRDRYKRMWETEKNISNIKSSVIDDKNKEISRLKAWRTVERIVTIPLSIWGGFKLVQGVVK